MKRLVSVLCVVGILIALVVPGDGGDKKGKDKGADGVWVVIGMEQGGMKVPAEIVENLKMKLTIKGDNYTVVMGDKVADKGTSKVDESKKPNTVDIKSEEGANKGKTILAIVEVTGDSMKACYDMEGKSRPTEFTTKEGNGHVFILYKREAKKKAE